MLTIVKRQNSPFLLGPGSSPQMHRLGKGIVFPGSPLICLNLLGLHFQGSRDGHRKPFVRHWLPQALTFSGEGLPSAPERPRGCDPRALDSSVLCQGQDHPQVLGLGAAKEAVRLGRQFQKSHKLNHQSSAWAQEHPDHRVPGEVWVYKADPPIPLTSLQGKPTNFMALGNVCFVTWIPQEKNFLPFAAKHAATTDPVLETCLTTSAKVSWAKILHRSLKNSFSFFNGWGGL